jgi:hypothetical protein
VGLGIHSAVLMRARMLNAIISRRYGFERCGFVPAFQAVYSGYTVNAGVLEWPVPNKSDASLMTWATHKPDQPPGSDLPSWKAYSALQLTFGHIPGAMMTEDLLFVLENSPSSLALWRDMMRVRAVARDYLVFGQLLRPPKPTVPLPTIQMCGNKPLQYYPCCPVAVVVASVFQAPNKTIAMVAANHGMEPVQYEAVVTIGNRHLNVSFQMPPSSARVVPIVLDSHTVA